MKIIGIMFCLMISLSANCQTNLLSNGTFDSSLQGWLGSGIWEPNDGGPSSGPGSARTQTSLLSERVYIVDGMDFHLLWSSKSLSSEDGVKLSIRWYNGTNFLNSSDILINYPGNNWSNYDNVITPIQGADNIRVTFTYVNVNNNNDYVLIDDIFIYSFINTNDFIFKNGFEGDLIFGNGFE